MMLCVDITSVERMNVVRVFASASVAVPMLVALSAVLVTGCGGSGDQTAEGVAGPDTDGGTTHQIGSLVVQTE